MADTDTNANSKPAGRGAGIVLLAAAMISLALLMNHPGDNATTFADVLKSEAAGQMIDAVVHGGSLVLFVIELACLAILAARIGVNRAPVVAALVFLAAGVAALCASMVLDGLVTPAIAAKYMAAPAKIEFAKSLFVLVGTTIRFVMPSGLFFEAVGIVLLGAALFSHRGLARGIGAFGLAVGGLVAAGLALTMQAMNPLVLMGSLIGIALWYALTGLALVLRKI